ncbi:Hok/Gef family protein [Erwinia sp. V71]|uniref:Hok/Gef family protein n=1 Tax=Erwinia sp. V71 TaxID=3369424 RepID=UPI003F643D32
MPRKYLLHALIVVCLTLLLSLWIIGDRLCEIRVTQGSNEYTAFLNYEFKS